MGCACGYGKNKITVTSECSPKESASQNKKLYSSNNKANLINQSLKINQNSNQIQKKRNYYQATSINNWVGIVDFLGYRDLKQIGKVNR